MASPHVAGVAALVLGANIFTDINNGAYVEIVRGRLQTTADNLEPIGWDAEYGFGLVDAKEAATGTP